MNEDDELDHQNIEIDDAEQVQQSPNLVSSPGVTVSLYTYFIAITAFKLLVDYNSDLKRHEVTKREMIALSKQSYRTAARKITKDSSISSYTLAALVHKVREEMTEICLLQHNSLFHNSHMTQ